MRYLVLCLAACGPTTAWEIADTDGLEHRLATERSRSRGIARFAFDVEESHESLLLTFNSENPYGAYVDSLTTPDGRVVFDAPALAATSFSLTGAQFGDTLAHLNWPILGTHADLQPGRWVAEVGALDPDFYLTKRVDIEATLTLKTDADLDAGILQVAVIYAGGAEGDPELVSATEAAVDQWMALYESFGITMEVQFETWEGPITDSPTGRSGDAYLAIKQSLPLGTVPMVVLPDFANWNGVFGISGGIPGPLTPTERSAVAVSGAVNSGPDLVFSDDEIRLYAETMAHEMGHYLGVFHPVEQDWRSWDAIGDTDNCSNENDCIDLFGDNLMFPFPVCGPASCQPQQVLTDGQASVFQRYTGVR